MVALEAANLNANRGAPSVFDPFIYFLRTKYFQTIKAAALMIYQNIIDFNYTE